MAQLYKGIGEFKPDSLIADNRFPILADGMKVKSGQGVLKRGTILGAGSDGKMYVTGSKAIIDSKEEVITADCILTDDIDTASADVISTGYIAGIFNSKALILAEGANLETYKSEMRKLGLYTAEVQNYA